jgi:hypothetical protein
LKIKTSRGVSNYFNVSIKGYLITTCNHLFFIILSVFVNSLLWLCHNNDSNWRLVREEISWWASSIKLLNISLHQICSFIIFTLRSTFVWPLLTLSTRVLHREKNQSFYLDHQHLLHTIVQFSISDKKYQVFIYREIDIHYYEINEQIKR